MSKRGLATLEAGSVIFLATRIVEGGLNDNKRKKLRLFY